MKGRRLVTVWSSGMKGEGVDNKKESFRCIEGSLPVKELKFVCGEFIFMKKKVIGKKFLMLLKTRQVLVE